LIFVLGFGGNFFRVKAVLEPVSLAKDVFEPPMSASN
jgi:hypothetical protein